MVVGDWLYHCQSKDAVRSLSTYIDDHLHLVLEVLRIVRRVKRGHVKKYGGRFALVQAERREAKERKVADEQRGRRS
jgi:hypothetical protein